MLDKLCAALSFAFKLYQYTCFSLILLLIVPVLALYTTDFLLYLFRLSRYYVAKRKLNNRCRQLKLVQDQSTLTQGSHIPSKEATKSIDDIQHDYVLAAWENTDFINIATDKVKSNNTTSRAYSIRKLLFPNSRIDNTSILSSNESSSMTTSSANKITMSITRADFQTRIQSTA